MFALADHARGRVGWTLDALGLGARETPWREVTKTRGARLRAYGPAEPAEGPVLLIFAAPIKRAYIWDLLPAVSVVRHARTRGFRVYLLEWLVPGAQDDGLCLADYADGLPALALQAIVAETVRPGVVLAGHSLGGTLAAIFATLHAEAVEALVLVEAPLAFASRGPLARAVAAAPAAHAVRRLSGSPVPGSFVGHWCTRLVPEVFLAQRWTDLAASLCNPSALAVRIRMERWALDEFPLPGALFDDIVERLYREDRFLHGALKIGDEITGVGRLRSPTLAVVNPRSLVVPPVAVLDGLAAVRSLSSCVLRFEDGAGAGLQHLGPLISPAAHRRLWPKVFDWLAPFVDRRLGHGEAARPNMQGSKATRQ
jgi:polyhydroxyalkanoate synthase